MIPSYLRYPSLHSYPWDGEGLAVPGAPTAAALEEGSRTEHWEMRAETQPGKWLALDIDRDESCTVTDSSDSQPAMTFSGTLIAPRDWTAQDRRALVHPDNETRFHLRVGYSSPRTGTYWYPLGVYVTSEDTAVAGSRAMAVSMGDQSLVVRRRSMLQRQYVAAGTPGGEAVMSVLNPRCPWVRLNRSGMANRTTAALWLGELGADLWDVCQDSIARPLACSLGFDREGALDMPLWSDPTIAQPSFVWEVGPDSVLVDVSTTSKRNADGVFASWGAGQGVVVYPEDAGHMVKFDGDETALDSRERALDALEAYYGRLRGEGNRVSATVWQNVRLKRDDVVLLRVPGFEHSELRARVASVKFSPGAPMTVDLVDRRVANDA